MAPLINKELGLQTRVSWPEKTPGAIEQAVRSGTADIGITYLPVPAPDVEHLSRPDYDTPSKAKGLDGWPDYRIPRNVHYRVTLLESALAMVAKGQCVGYFPSFVAELYNSHEQRLFELQGLKVNEPKQDVFLVKRIDEEETGASKKIAKVLRGLKKS